MIQGRDKNWVENEREDFLKFLLFYLVNKEIRQKTERKKKFKICLLV